MSGKAGSRTRLDPEVRREQILDAAERVFVSRDPAEVTFEELAQAAGVSRALVYNYFGDKGGLVAAVYLRSLGRLNAALDHTVDPTAGYDVRLQAAVRGYLAFAVDGDDWRVMGVTAGFDHPDVRRVRRQRFDDLARRWGDTTPARILARGMIHFLEGATAAWIDAGAGDLDEVAEMVYRTLWYGMSSMAPPSTARQQYQAATLR